MMRKITLSLSINEMNLILEGLGQMPYARVFSLVENLQKQAAEELREDQAGIDEAGEHQPDQAESASTITSVS